MKSSTAWYICDDDYDDFDTFCDEKKGSFTSESVD